jgi:hypothetical protein
MIDEVRLPEQLIENIGSERKEFSILSKRSQPVKASVGLIVFGTAWLAFTSIFVVVFLGPLLVGNEVHFTANGEPVVAGPGNLRPALAPALVIGLFVLIGILILGFGIYSLFKKGGYFVGTPTRLIHYYNGNIRSIDWEQFSGDIEVSGNELTGNLALKMRTGKMVSRKNAPDEYVPDVMYISGIPGVMEVERICRTRIKENDPTPVGNGEEVR